MERSRKKQLPCALMTLLMVLMLSLPASANFHYVPGGWLTPAPGYWTDEQGGRDTYSAIKYYRLRGDKLEEAYNELNQMTLAHNEAMSQKIDDLIKAQDAERAAWKAELRKARMPGVGIFAGYGFGYEGHNDFVVGIGLVWKIW